MGVADIGVGWTSWGTSWADIDLDTDLDLMIVNGSITSANLYAQRFTSSSLTSSPITATNEQSAADIACEPASDQYLTVWEDGRSGTTQIYGQRINSVRLLLCPLI